MIVYVTNNKESWTLTSPTLVAADYICGIIQWMNSVLQTVEMNFEMLSQRHHGFFMESLLSDLKSNLVHLRYSWELKCTFISHLWFDNIWFANWFLMDVHLNTLKRPAYYIHYASPPPKGQDIQQAYNFFVSVTAGSLHCNLHLY